MVCTLGGSVADPRVDNEGNINIIDAAIKKGVKKFILVTSVGCGDSKDAPGDLQAAAVGWATKATGQKRETAGKYGSTTWGRNHLRTLVKLNEIVWGGRWGRHAIKWSDGQVRGIGVGRLAGFGVMLPGHGNRRLG